MKKVFKILTALTLALTVTLSATACSKIKKMNDIYDFKNPTLSTVLNTATKLTVGDYTDCEGVVGSYVILSRTVTVKGEPSKTTYDFALYDWKSKAFVDSVEGLTEKVAPFVALGGVNAVAKIPAEEGDNYTVFYNGEKSFETDSIAVTPNTKGIGVYKIGDYAVYDTKDGITAVENKKINVADICGEQNGYFYREDTAGRMLLIYDDELDLYGKISLPTYVTQIDEVDKWFFPLSNGNVLVQYFYIADQYGDEYDVIMDGNKYFVKQQIYNAEDNSTEDVKLGYVVTSCTPASLLEKQAKYQIKDKVHNVCYGYKIEEQRISFTEAETAIFSMSNDGELIVFEKSFKTQSYTLEIALGEDSFLSLNVADDWVLINKKGDVKVTFEDQVSYLGGAIVDDDKYYTLGGDLILDNSNGEYEESFVLSGGTIFTKTITADNLTSVEYYLMSNGAIKLIATDYDAADTARESSSKVLLDGESISHGIYAVQTTTKKDGNTSTTVYFYNVNGEKLYGYLPSKDDKGDVFKGFKVKYQGYLGVVIQVELDKWDAESEGFMKAGELIVFENTAK